MSETPLVDRSAPQQTPKLPEGAGENLVVVRDLKKYFPIRRGILSRVVGQVKAVDGISFAVAKGETLGLVGESGSGKTTVGRCILRLIEPTDGEVRFENTDVRALDSGDLRDIRRHMQIVFQDPYGSLNPRMRVSTIVGEPLAIHGTSSRSERDDQVAELGIGDYGVPVRPSRRRTGCTAQRQRRRQRYRCPDNPPQRHSLSSFAPRLRASDSSTVRSSGSPISRKLSPSSIGIGFNDGGAVRAPSAAGGLTSPCRSLTRTTAL
jgi:hypothetical protein